MAISFVRTFSKQDKAAKWAALMNKQGYSIAMSDVCDDVQLLKEDNTGWIDIPEIKDGYFIVLAFNRNGSKDDA